MLTFGVSINFLKNQAMESKERSITKVSTGEIFTGSINELADFTGISSRTLIRYFNIGRSMNPEWEILTKAEEEVQDSDTMPSDVSVLKDDEFSEELRKKRYDDNNLARPPVIYTKPVEDVMDIPTAVTTEWMGEVGKDIPVVREKKILPRNPCYKCGLLTYHTLNVDGEIKHVCYGKCTPPEEPVVYKRADLSGISTLPKGMKKGVDIPAPHIN
jgi:hypothetical protein